MSKSIKQYKNAMNSIKISESFERRTEALLKEMNKEENGTALKGMSDDFSSSENDGCRLNKGFPKRNFSLSAAAVVAAGIIVFLYLIQSETRKLPLIQQPLSRSRPSLTK
ncbi:MAG: hypothetical protein LUI05_05110 [Oscillospiraceae bacterium]|nr:hypothetical protein [Oscillospiraceae bacterium]